MTDSKKDTLNLQQGFEAKAEYEVWDALLEDSLGGVDKALLDKAIEAVTAEHAPL